MKGHKDILGSILDVILLLGCVACVIGAIIMFGGSNIIGALVFLGAAFGCLLVGWLISTLRKILSNIVEINAKLSNGKTE